MTQRRGATNARIYPGASKRKPRTALKDRKIEGDTVDPVEVAGEVRRDNNVTDKLDPTSKVSRKRWNGAKLSNNWANEVRNLMNAKTVAAAEEITDALINHAIAGDMNAAAILVNRIWPARPGSMILFKFPKINSPADLGPAVDCIIDHVANAQLSLEEGNRLAALVQHRAEAFERAEISGELERMRARLVELEAQAHIKPAMPGMMGASHRPN